MPLVDLGAEVIKVEPPSGDYIREMTWPIVEGVSLMHLHVNRGKRSIVMDLRNEEDVATFKELAATADVVVEAMRPGGLARRGVGYDDLRRSTPRIVFCTISGYGMTGPYQNLPAHGVAFDTWAGIVTPQVNEEGFAYLPEHASIGIHAGPLFGALGILAAVLRARTTGEGSFLEIAQSDAAAAMDWYRSETWKAYERPESEVTGNKADDYERRDPGTAGMIEGVRYQVYEAKDGRYVLFMASEQAFWKNFCEAVGPHRALRALAGLQVRRPRPRQPRAPGRAARHLPHAHRRRVDRLRRRAANFPVAPVNTPQDHRRRPAVPGPVPLDPRRRPRRRPAPDAAQVRRRGPPHPHQGPDRRPAHRRGAPGPARVGRRPHRRVPGRPGGGLAAGPRPRTRRSDRR